MENSDNIEVDYEDFKEMTLEEVIKRSGEFNYVTLKDGSVIAIKAPGTSEKGNLSHLKEDQKTEEIIESNPEILEDQEKLKITLDQENFIDHGSKEENIEQNEKEWVNTQKEDIKKENKKIEEKINENFVDENSYNNEKYQTKFNKKGNSTQRIPKMENEMTFKEKEIIALDTYNEDKQENNNYPKEMKEEGRNHFYKSKPYDYLIERPPDRKHPVYREEQYYRPPPYQKMGYSQNYYYDQSDYNNREREEYYPPRSYYREEYPEDNIYYNYYNYPKNRYYPQENNYYYEEEEEKEERKENSNIYISKEHNYPKKVIYVEEREEMPRFNKEPKMRARYPKENYKIEVSNEPLSYGNKREPIYENNYFFEMPSRQSRRRSEEKRCINPPKTIVACNDCERYLEERYQERPVQQNYTRYGINWKGNHQYWEIKGRCPPRKVAGRRTKH